MWLTYSLPSAFAVGNYLSVQLLVLPIQFSSTYEAIVAISSSHQAFNTAQEKLSPVLSNGRHDQIQLPIARSCKRHFNC